MAVQPFLIQKQKEQKAPEKDALDYLMTGLQVANSAFGIASNYQNIQSAKQQRELALQQADQNKQQFAQTKEMNDLKIAEAKSQAATPKADYTQRDLDELVSKGGVRIGKQGEVGETRSVLLPDKTTRSVLLVDANPEKAAAAAKEKAAERSKDITIAKLANASKAALADLKRVNKDEAYDSLPKESKIQVDKIAGSMGDVTAVRNSLQGDLEAFKNAKTEAEKITIGESMIKTLNSKMGKDAVGTEEANRLAPYLTYQKLNFTGPGAFVGRDLEAFQKQVEASMAGMDRSIQLGSEKINELKGIAPQQTQTAQGRASSPASTASMTPQDQARIKWAQDNPNDPRSAEVLKRYNMFVPKTQNAGMSTIPPTGGTPALSFGGR